MRELKFRIWDKKECWIFNPPFYDVWLINRGTGKKRHFEEFMESESIDTEYQYIWEQYTGLKDKK